MNFVFITDTHGRANNPISRKDDFPQTVLSKIYWAVELANKHEAPLLHGGDWLQRPDVSPTFISHLAKILMKAKYGVYSVLGNHDIYSYNQESFWRSPLSILVNCGIIKLVDEKGVEFRDDLFERTHEGAAVKVTGVSAHQMLDKNGRVEDYIVPEKTDGVYTIHIVHGFLANKDWGKNIPHTLIDNTAEGNFADVVLTGHEHSGYNVIEKTNSTGHRIIYCNPGSLLRVTAGVGDMRDDVQAALIEATKDEISVRLVKCPIAEDADKVLDRAKLEEEKTRTKSLELFASKLSGISSEFKLEKLEVSTAAEMLTKFVEEIKKDDELSMLTADDIIKESFALLSEAEEQMIENNKKRRVSE